MESLVECTQCGVLMTSWCAAGSSTRYYQCPFCKRTLCSTYGEVFERGALGRKVGAAPRARAGGRDPMPEATPDEKSWREMKGRAARWFARLEAEGRRLEPAAQVPAVALSASRVRA
ncbi:MAG: hypothetical protein NTY18_08145 [Deltaproteobacteria bacterium]|jgi:hypothetical protein|nr:hypothetical protein [Deltaproteobacteria bacterium]